MKEGYQSALCYVVYNGPPNTIYAEYRDSVQTEGGLVDAVRTCSSLYRYITDPSERVTATQIKYHGLGDVAPDLEITKAIAGAMVQHNHRKFPDYAEYFTDQEVTEMAESEPQLLRYVKGQTLEMCDRAIDAMARQMACKTYTELLHGGAALWHKNIDCTFTSAFNTSTLSRDEIGVLYSKMYRLEPRSIEYMSPEYVSYDMLAKYIRTCPKFLREWTRRDPAGGLLTTGQIQQFYSEMVERAIYNIEYVDPEYQTPRMTELVTRSPNGVVYYQYIPSLDISYYLSEFRKNPDNIRHIPEQYRTGDMCELAVRHNPHNIAYVPAQFQTPDMCSLCCRTKVELVSYCQYVTRDMLLEVHKQKRSEPRVSRFRFINNLPEDKICQILGVMPDLLMHLYPYNLTDKVVRTALETDGYTLQYIEAERQTPSLISLALCNQPRASKYVKPGHAVSEAHEVPVSVPVPECKMS